MIRKAMIEDLPKMIGLAKEFYNSSKFLDRFNLNIFVINWTNFINNGIGVIWILNDFDGCLGAIKYPDANNGELIATELFWFVSLNKRREGTKLLTEFEKWAKNEGCKRIIMGYLKDLMPDKVERFYEKMGYRAMETNYIKEIQNVI